MRYSVSAYLLILVSLVGLQPFGFKFAGLDGVKASGRDTEPDDQGGPVVPKVILQLSDLHMSTNAKHHWRSFGDRQGDFRLFVNTLIPHIHPNVILITGDLTDSKDRSGAGRQDREEWEMYRGLLDALDDAGIDPYHVLDVRGNHDMFNVDTVRASLHSFAHNFTAFGQRGAGNKRTFAHVLFSSGRLLEVDEVHGEGEASEGLAGSAEKAFVSLPAAGTETGGSTPLLNRWLESIRAFFPPFSSGSVDSKAYQKGTLSLQEGSPHDVPIAAFLGVDFSIDPGLKNPFNFFGQLNTPLRESISASSKALIQALERSVSQKPGESVVPIIAYGHFPLSTVDSKFDQYESKSKLFGSTVAAVSHVVRGSSDPLHPQNPVAVMTSEAPITTYISGHLHTAFGERMHKAHRIVREVTEKATMSELETGAWKDDRRFRLIIVDRGVLSFVDYYFVTLHTPKRPRRSDFLMMQQNLDWKNRFEQRGWGVTATNHFIIARPTKDGENGENGERKEHTINEAAVVLDHFVIMTYPPDLRFAPQQAFRGPSTFNLSEENEPAGFKSPLTAVVIPVINGSGDSKSTNFDIAVKAIGYLDIDGRPSAVQLFETRLFPLVVTTLNRSLIDDYHGQLDTMEVFGMLENDTAVMVDRKLVQEGEEDELNELVAWVRIAVSSETGASLSPLVPIALTCLDNVSDHTNQDGVYGQNGLLNSKGGKVYIPCRPSPSLGLSSDRSVPVGADWLESMMLSLNWPVYLHRLYISLWSFFVVILLIIPFLVATVQAQRPALSHRPRKGPFWVVEPILGNKPSAGSTHFRRVLKSLIIGVKFPFAALLYTATVKRAWISMVRKQLSSSILHFLQHDCRFNNS
jgi:hypothetical protein